MKKLTLLFLSLLAGFSVFAQKDAIDFNDKIVDEQNKIGQRIVDFNYAAENSTDMELPRKLILEQIEASIAVVEKMTWQDGVDLKTASLELFKFYSSVVSIEYKEMVEILKHETLSEADNARLNELIKIVTDKEAKYDADFAREQEAFAKRWNIELMPNEMQEQIDGN